MMHKEISSYLNGLSDNLTMVNKLIVGAYLQFNDIKLQHNRLISSCIEGNDKKQVENFIELIKIKNGKFDFEDLIQLFEITIPIDDTIVNGAVYTPKYIKDYIVEKAFSSLVKCDYKKVLVGDIACGTGAFLYTVAQEIKEKTSKSFFDIFKDNIFGLDISDYTIERVKILLTLLALSHGEDRDDFEFNLSVGNALNFDWYKEYTNFNGFDLLVGNPPYVRSKHLSDETKMLMSNWEVTKSGNADLYIPFFEIGLKYLKDKVGLLGYITVNTFKRSVNARKLREFFNENQLKLSILDFGSHQVFSKKSTYTCIVFIENKSSKTIQYEKINPKDIVKKRVFSKITYTSLDTHKGWLLNTKEVLENIKKIESIGISLGNKYPIKNGLATLSNDVFIFNPIDEDEDYYYLQNEKLYKVEKSICRDVIKPNRLKIEEEIEALTEKIIFPYYYEKESKVYNVVSTKKRVFEEEYFKNKFPYAYAYLRRHKKQLLNRDKGKSNKYEWFEFGRTQALADYGEKLLFPYMAGQPYFVYSNQKDLLFYAGYAIFLDSKSEREITILKRILESEVFWYYIKETSKPYSGNFYALAKNYVKDFGICELSKEEEDFILGSHSQSKINKFLMRKYGLDNSSFKTVLYDKVLLSNHSSYITGETLKVNGGMLM